MVNVTRFLSSQKAELAEIIRKDNLDFVNEKVQQVQVKNSFYTRHGKRLFDIVIALIALIVSSPINLLIAVITFFDVGSPIIFKQQRIGKNGEKFTIYKFRNMTNATDANGELLPPAQRVTKCGRFVRKVSLDELLNFVSILKGDMSVVGPRPLLDAYAGRFNKRDRQRYCVRPGLECPPYHHLEHAMTWNEKLDNDVWYVQNCSLKVDIVLLFRIVQLAFNRKNADIRSKANAGGFLGYNRDGTVITTQNVPEKYYDMLCIKFGYGMIKDTFLENKDSKQEIKIKVGV